MKPERLLKGRTVSSVARHDSQPTGGDHSRTRWPHRRWSRAFAVGSAVAVPDALARAPRKRRQLASDNMRFTNEVTRIASDLLPCFCEKTWPRQTCHPFRADRCRAREDAAPTRRRAHHAWNRPPHFQISPVEVTHVRAGRAASVVFGERGAQRWPQCRQTTSATNYRCCRPLQRRSRADSARLIASRRSRSKLVSNGPTSRLPQP